ncbi:hypothetical protein BROOK1789B_1048 [Bathymodiolus brooksi thiotrophic gill symbiont]|nr:hypothetical protein BROOK1789B_1048 [Bathymodiolus brooksi thiotrophic gill symbiont]
MHIQDGGFFKPEFFYKDFLKKYFVRGCGHFSEVKYLTLHHRGLLRFLFFFRVL